MLNRIELIGNAGTDPIVRTTEQGQKFASITMATSEHYTDKKGDKITVTDWHNVVAWRNAAENLSKIKKGMLFMVIGKSKTRKYTDKNGAEKYITEVVVDICYPIYNAVNSPTNSDIDQQSGTANKNSGSGIQMT